MSLKEALKIHKYGMLTSWTDLLFYQAKCGDLKQIREIANFARRHKEGEAITLPLAEYVKKLTLAKGQS